MGSKKPYVEPVLEKREKLSDISQGVIIRITGGQDRDGIN